MGDQKEKLTDLALALKSEATDSLISHENLPTIIQDIAKHVMSEGAAEIFGNLLGAISPRINGVISSYRQNRFERNVEQALVVMRTRLNVLESNINNVKEEVKTKIGREYLEWMLDNLYNERQGEKIPYHVNGYINLMTNEANDNLMITFFDTLNELTQLDIEVLAMYQLDSPDNIYTLSKRNGLLPEQITVIKEKLVRHGLLDSRNNDLRDDNIDKIAEYLINSSKDMKKSKPQGILPPKLKKPRSSDSYQINALGRGFLKTIAYSDNSPYYQNTVDGSSSL